MQVFTSSIVVMSNSSNDSPGFGLINESFGIPLFHWYDHPCNAGLLQSLIVLLPFIYSPVGLKFFTIANVSFEKCNISSFVCLVGFSQKGQNITVWLPLSPPPLKSVFLSTYISSLGKLPSLKISLPVHRWVLPLSHSECLNWKLVENIMPQLSNDLTSFCASDWHQRITPEVNKCFCYSMIAHYSVSFTSTWKSFKFVEV